MASVGDDLYWLDSAAARAAVRAATGASDLSEVPAATSDAERLAVCGGGSGGGDIDFGNSDDDDHDEDSDIDLSMGEDAGA